MHSPPPRPPQRGNPNAAATIKNKIMKKPWQLTATFSGETHRLTGSTKKELITTLATLIVAIAKEEE